MEDQKNEIVTYWASRKINIGQYEGRDFGLSYTANIRHINKLERTLTISGKESISVEEHLEDFMKSAERSMKRVDHLLDKEEIKIRSQMAAFEDEETLDHVAKLEAQGLKPDFKQHKRKRGDGRKQLADNDDEFTTKETIEDTQRG